MVLTISKSEFLQRTAGKIYSFEEACELEEFLYNNFPTDTNPIIWINNDTKKEIIIGSNNFSMTKKVKTKAEKKADLDYNSAKKSKETIKKIIKIKNGLDRRYK